MTIGVADGTSTYIVERVAPGHSVERHLRVGNTTPDSLTAAVYAGAASISGGFHWGDGHAQNALTRWTSVHPNRVSIPTQRAVDITVKIRVPDDELPGTHYAVVWAELPRSDSGVVNRVGMRIYLTVTKPSGSHAGLILASVAIALLALAITAIVLAARRRGSAPEDSTTASP